MLFVKMTNFSRLKYNYKRCILSHRTYKNDLVVVRVREREKERERERENTMCTILLSYKLIQPSHIEVDDRCSRKKRNTTREIETN